MALCFSPPLYNKDPLSALNQSNQQLRDLHRVQRRALLDLVPADEDVEALFVLARDVPTSWIFFRLFLVYFFEEVSKEKRQREPRLSFPTPPPPPKKKKKNSLSTSSPHRMRPTKTSSLLLASKGVGNLLFALSLIKETPAASPKISTALSSESSVANSKLIDSACARITGTRMHVAVTAKSSPETLQIFCVSLTNFISSSLYPLAVIGELWLKRLKAYWNGKMFLVTGLPSRASLVWSSSSSK